MKKYLHIVVALLVLIHSLAVPLELMAQEMPEIPSIPSAPVPPTAPETPQAPTNPTQPSPIVTTQPTPKPTKTPRPENTPMPESVATTPTPSTNATQNSPTPQGDTRIATGDATTEGTLITTANNNQAVAPTESSSVGGVAIVENGADSTNTATIEDASVTNTIQENSAAINNNLELSAESGSNQSSGNMGETLIKTGDANVSGTVITSVNTNVDGLVLSEFEIADDHTGDIILDFGAQCVNCTNGNAQAITKGNGKGSENTTNLIDTNTEGTFQSNEATLGNTLTLEANSGLNTSDANTGGDTTIYTGDANVNANMITMANNNIAGNIVYGVVNIYGDLVGDIIFPEEQLTSCCSNGSTTTTTANNGANSNNSTQVSETNTELTFQTNEADISNTLNLTGETGNNDVSANTGGDNRILTGDAQVVANAVTVANTNLDGGNMWLVIINEAGQWIGKILGNPSGSTMAASEGTTLTTNEFGEVVATSGNGANSQNTTNISNTNSNTTVQTNTANIDNTLNLSANTGGNSASKNTNGDSNIVTGDATIIANMVNFVNNNITGGGKLFVTVVNVFGSWIGDFVTPGQHKDQPQQENTNLSQSTNTSVDVNQNVVQNNTSTAQSSPSTQSNLSSSTPTIVKRFNAAILGDSHNDESATHELSQEDTSESFDAPEATITPIVAGKRVVSINLAWLIFIIPGGILLLAIKKLVAKATSIHKE
jgi:hypothetical protein